MRLIQMAERGLSFIYILTALLIIHLLLAPAARGGDTIHIFRLTDAPRFEIIESGPSGIEVRYEIGSIALIDASREEGDFYTLSIPGHHEIYNPGRPSLPVISHILNTTGYGSYKIAISDVRTAGIDPHHYGASGHLFPIQPQFPKSQTSQRERFMIDSDYYKRDAFTVLDTATTESIGVMRDNHLSALSVNPVRYNPAANRIDVITSMTIEVTFIRQITTPDIKAMGGLPAEEPLLSGKDIKSFSPEQLINGFSRKPLGMIIVSDTIFSEAIEPLIRWKTAKGFRVTTLYRGENYAGVTFRELRDTIKAIFHNPPAHSAPPDYLLIIGSLDHIPRSEGTSFISDLYYGEFTGGGDYIPEIYIGRLPVRDTIEARAVVEKIIEYETFSFADTNSFYSNALITAGNDSHYQEYMNGHINYATTYYLNDSNGISTTAFLYPQSTAMRDSIIALLSSGIGFLNYTGHGSTTSWESPAFSHSDIAGLNNRGMYPLVISNACRTGNFAVNNNLATRFVVTPERGAIGFIGCTHDAYWAEDYYWAVGAGAIDLNPIYVSGQYGFYDRFFHIKGELPSDWYYTMGQINFAGNLAVSASSSHRKRRYWETYHLIGDPSLTPYTGTPEEITIELPDTLPAGTRSLYIETTPFLYAAISTADSLWDASSVGPSGYADLNISGMDGDSSLLVITGQNRIPLIKTIHFADIESPGLQIDSISIDDSSGNGNGMAEYGETAALDVVVSNRGEATATGSWIKISSESPWVSIKNDSLYIGDVDGGSSVTTGAALEFTIDELIPDQAISTFTITFAHDTTVKTRLYDLKLNAPDLSLRQMYIDDTETGNGNFAADRGETVDIVVTAGNSGGAATAGLIRVTSQPGGLTFHNTEQPTGTLAPGEIRDISLRATVSDTLLRGTIIPFDLELECGAYSVSKSYEIRTGLTRESFGHQSFDIFPWINESQVPWEITSYDAIDGHFSARSGHITHSESTSLQIDLSIPWPDSVSFWYRVSSERNYDHFRFSINDQEVLRDSGESGWVMFTAPLPSGTSRLEWSYSKDVTITHGSDRVWIDKIDFPSYAFVKRDIELIDIVSPYISDSFDFEPVTVIVRNNGELPVNGFNLAYSVNEQTPHTTQFFSLQLQPGESRMVTFSEYADLTLYGEYSIVVYGFDNNDDVPENDTTRTSVTHMINGSDTRVFPNPFDQSINISISSPDYEKVAVRVTDLSGRTLFTTRRFLNEGGNLLTIDLPGIAPGHYILSLNGVSVNKQFIIIRSGRLNDKR